MFVLYASGHWYFGSMKLTVVVIMCSLSSLFWLPQARKQTKSLLLKERNGKVQDWEGFRYLFLLITCRKLAASLISVSHIYNLLFIRFMISIKICKKLYFVGLNCKQSYTSSLDSEMTALTLASIGKSYWKQPCCDKEFIQGELIGLIFFSIKRGKGIII